MDWQLVVVSLIILVALGYLARSAKQAFSTGTTGCGTCRCPTPEHEDKREPEARTPLTLLDSAQTKQR